MIKLLNYLYNKLKKAVLLFLPLQMVWSIIFIALRFIEIILESNAHGIPNLLTKIIFIALLKDFSFILTASFWLFLFFYVLHLAYPKKAVIIYTVVAVLMAIIQLILSHYFVTTLVPLGADLWTYSFADIKQTVGAAGIQWSIVFIMLLVFAACILAFLKLKKRFKPTLKFAFIIISICSIAQFFSLAKVVNQLSISTEQGNSLAINKSYYFYKQSLLKFFPPESDIDIYADSYINDTDTSSTSFIKNFSYVNDQLYPFLHNDTLTDVLSPFFKPTNQKPNIVFILVEGLGRAFSNKGAYLGSFTPFLDSVSENSLYWENFLSQSGRTFAVLPSVLGSLPFAENGFLEMKNAIPNNLNLINILASNGYNTGFSYGGNSAFDYMNIFLRKSKIASITDINNFPKSYKQMPANNNFSWGFGDKELFNFYLSKQKESSVPLLQILLTVSTHSPFLINEQQYYHQKFEQHLQKLGISESQKEDYRNYKNQYSSILYTDDAIKDFIQSYAKRADFNNTVFVITGDHRMPEIPMNTKLDRYHVPFIIYSPLLKRTAKFSSVSAHVDIAPTILAWLQKSYQVKIPKQNSFIGTGLDTARAFRNTHQYAFMQTKEGVNALIQGNYFLEQESFFELNSNFSLTTISDETIKSKLKTTLEQIKQRNQKIATGAKLIPDSTYYKFVPK